MHTWAWLITGGFILALTAAAAGADSNAGHDDNKPTTRPAARSERGAKNAEPRRPGRRNPGDGDAHRRPPGEDRDDRDLENPPEPPDEPGLGPMPPAGEGRGGPMFGPDPERTRRVMKFLKEHYPRMHERLAELQDRDPRAFHRQMMRMLPRLPELMGILERNPKLGKLMIEEHQLEMDIRDATMEYHRARTEATPAQMKERLRELIGKQFDIRQEKLQLMISEMERELARKKEQLSEQAAKKDEVIKRELERRLSAE